MKKIEDICIVVQARLSSQRCIQKMIRPFGPNGESLLEILADKLKYSILPASQIHFSLWDEPLKEIIRRKTPFYIYHRSEASATTDNDMQLMYEWWKLLSEKYKWVVMINPCLPFLPILEIDSFINTYCSHDESGQFGVIQTKDYYWDENFNLITKWPDSEDVMNTKAVGYTYKAAHALYAGSLIDIGKGVWMADPKKGFNMKLFPMKEQHCLDIDYEWQFNMLRTIYGTCNRY